MSQVSFPCLLSHASCPMPSFPLHLSVSPVSHLLSLISCLLSHISCLASPLSHLLSLVSCLLVLSPIFCLHILSSFSGLPSPVTLFWSPVSCHSFLSHSHVSHLTSTVSSAGPKPLFYFTPPRWVPLFKSLCHCTTAPFFQLKFLPYHIRVTLWHCTT